jgi:menaquinone-specific isochorismate synthase
MTVLRPGTLLTYALPWPEASLLGFLHLGKGHPRVYWESERSPRGFAGFGVAAQLTASGKGRFTQIAADVTRLFNQIHRVTDNSPAGADPVFAGGFSFRSGNEPGDPYWAAFCEAQFILPRYQLTHFDGETWLTINHVLAPGEDSTDVTRLLRETAEDLVWQGLAGDYASPTIDDAPVELRPIHVTPFTSHDGWVQMISETIQRIHRGELKKAVLARTTHIEFARSLPLASLLARLSARYPDCYRFLVEPQPEQAFFGATPELLAEVSSQQFRTVALAGSTRRGSTWQEDQALGEQLLSDPKERHEHDLVVRALQESLHSLTLDLAIPDSPELYLLNNIQHLRTPINGRLANGKGIVPVIQALHPTPALGGTPSDVALPLIGRLEPLQRGWYGAPVGWLAPNGEGEFAVAIRSAVMDGKKVRLYAGAGIVADSDPEKEWRETELKFQPILKAFGL